MTGVIERRILANYRVDPAALAKVLPGRFRPKVVEGAGLAGICLIRLGGIRPGGFPAAVGLSSENAAHRIAVEWDEDGPGGRTHEGVYVMRRDTSSRLNALAGGRLVAGVHHHAAFDVQEGEGRYHVALRSDDGRTRVSLDGRVSEDFPAGSVFGSIGEASDFFRAGSVGYSPGRREGTYQGLELRSERWAVESLDVERMESSFFDDETIFPKGSVRFDCALLMRDVAHEWHSRGDLAG